MTKNHWLLWIPVVVAACADLSPDEASVASTVHKHEHKHKHKHKCKPGKKHRKKCVVTQATIGVEGGRLTTTDGVILDVPFGALAEPTTLTVTTSTLEVAASLSPVYVFEPEGTVFARPLDVTLPLPAGVTSASMYWSRLGKPGFDPIGGTIDAAAGTITATTGHFSEAYVGPESSTRTVSGLYVRTWISASARVDEKLDFSADTVKALVDTGASYTAIDGHAGGALGTFEIDDVPNGEYVLYADTGDAASDVYVVTSTNTPDLGTSFGGRPIAQRTQVTSPTALNLDLANMVPWSEGDQLELFATEADDWHFGLHFYAPALAIGDAAAAVSFDLRDAGNPLFGASAIDGTAGDRVIVAQLAERTSANSWTYSSLSRIKQLDPFDLPNGGTYSAAVTLDDVALDKSVAIDWRGTQFAAELAIDDNPAGETTCLACGGMVGVLGQAGYASDGFYTANADLLLVYDQAAGGTDIDSGTMTYGSTSSLPGRWGELFLARYRRRLRLRLPDTSAGVLLFAGYNWVTTVDTGTTTTLAPRLTQPDEVTVDEIDAFTGSATISATPTVSWRPPRIGSPDLYEINVLELGVGGNNNTTRRPVARIVTPHTSFRFPSGIIDTTKAYAFGILAIAGTTAEARAGLLAQPLRPRLDVVSANVISAIFGPARGTP